MKRSVLLVSMLAVFAPSVAFAGCQKVEYQELKEYSEPDLLKKYCKDKFSFELAEIVASSAQSSAKASRALGDLRGSSRALTEWGQANTEVEVCKSEMERVVRILVQHGKDEAAAKASCGGPVPPLASNEKIKISE